MFSKKPQKKQEYVPRRRVAQDEATKLTNSPQPPAAPEKTPLYQRNRTLSSYRHNTLEESSRQKVHQLSGQRRKLGGIFIAVLITVVLLVVLLFQLIVQVQVATSTKPLTKGFSAQAYEKAISEYLQLNPAQHLKSTLDQKSLSTFVSSKYPEVEAVALKGNLTIIEGAFSITFRTPVAGWQIKGEQYYVDAQGVVFKQNYYAAPSVQIVDESGATGEQGTMVAGSRLLGFIGKVVAQAQSRGYIVLKATLPQGMTRQIDLTFKDVVPYVKFSVDRGAGEQVEDFDRAYKFMKARGIGAQYIDIRISGRAAYK